MAKSRGARALRKDESEDEEDFEGGDEGPEDEDGDDGDEGEEMEMKSDLTPDELRKSLSRLEELASAQTPASRKEALLAKALNSDLETEEREELLSLMGGRPNPNSLPAQVAKAMDPTENDTLQKSIDVSDFLSEMHGATARALDTLAEAIEKSSNGQHEFNVVLAKSVLDMSRVLAQQTEMTKAMSSRLGVIESQPARAPKSKGLAAPIEKSFAGEPAGGQLSKRQVLDTLEHMLIKSDANGYGGNAVCGENLLNAIAKYEATDQISKSLYAEMVGFMRDGKAVH